MKVALFGTSADPPTAGHQAVIRWLSDHFDWVAVWAANNPLKSHQTPLEHRVAMLHLLILDIDSSKHNIGLEQELSHLRTLETLEKAKKCWSEAEFTLVVGSDLLTQLPRWYHIEDLLQQVQLLVIPRPRYAIDESNLDIVQKLGGKVTVANFIGLDVSSTAYRKNGDLSALTPLVVDYINKEHLYKCVPENLIC
ncbi:nicotinate-nucleotide adenylyltransferase [Brasilonema bromeliae]|uniref:Probable nicotinate-nucleotide adenylyltransferase n=1 Tax=Brasilonema bromeliae SPC951 TaxID=385972 RepID=A0ABX1P1C0_9CYAN|nr:nicotinate-nucleotide adenylyltransferase [Brasilonema bromeliae]NMG18120.1 nicotinic acid mononucleotide adenylyltransferase [Brasilonema bromeliae SPC951]